MAGRRRPMTRRTESVEPGTDIVTRQTRRNAKRLKASIEPEDRPEPEIPQRGTRRRRRKSLESVATNDFPKSSNGHASPEPENRDTRLESELIESEDEAISGSGADHIYESPEMEAARIRDMLEFDIPKLMRWSATMYNVLSSIGDSRPSAEERSKLNDARKSHNLARLPFADQVTLFTEPDNLFGKCDPVHRAMIDDANCIGNLISLLASIVDVRFAKKSSSLLLEQLDAVFPAAFNSAFRKKIAGDEKTLDLAFRIRCRRLVELVVADSSADPFQLATSVFCTQSVRGLGSARDALRRGPYKELAGIDLDQGVAFHDIFQTRIQDLVLKLASKTRFEVQSSLDQACPRETLFHDLRLWALKMYQQIHRRVEEGSTRLVSHTPASHAFTRRRDSVSMFVDLDDDDDIGEDSDSASDTDTGGYVQLAPKESNQSLIVNAAALAAVRQSERVADRSVTKTPPSNQQASKGKEKAVDTRDAIRRLEPGHLLNRAGKRFHSSVTDDDEEDNDDDFEVNEQLLDESRRVRVEHNTTQRTSPKRPTFSKRRRAGSFQIPSSQTTRGQPAGDFLEDPNLREGDIKVLSQDARNSRRANYANKPRQVRMPWSASDTSRLVDLIADPSLSCSWSAMEKAGGFEISRNQQALRDKARGLKVLYLQGDGVLPPGFDQIALGQKEKDAVTSCNRNPNRRVEDLNEDGKVINNIWAG
ncbi:hypothetical protein GGR54DRAFT_603452 [Hypoxylon sp. NC1633]|nr:hypothetical protein GGR54DRAFT_603452 [Hypoxylon sp. NC1633]